VTGGNLYATGDDTWTGNVLFGTSSGYSVFRYRPNFGSSLRMTGDLTSLGQGEIHVTNSGRTILDGTTTLSNSFNNLVIVQSGALEVNGSLVNPLQRVQIGNGTLEGSGSIVSNQSDPNYRVRLEGSATLSPGPAGGTGVLTVGNSLRFFNSGNQVKIDINGANVGTQYDQVNVTGDIDLGGAALNVSLGYAAIVGSSYTIINNDGTDAVVGTFAGLGEGGQVTINGHTFQISYVGGTGNDVVLTAVNGLPIGTVTSAAVINNKLVIADSSTSGKNDNLKVSFDGTNYTIQDTSTPTANTIQYVNISGATGNGTSTITPVSMTGTVR
ncbi:MAG: hypothetical protein WBD31_10930, partial [Rubripirellula sp.]